jgi:hypothetical protein
MKYLCLIYYDKKEIDSMIRSEAEAICTEARAYSEILQENGHLIAGEALQPVHTAATVRVRNRKLFITDGPIAETKEQLCSFILIEATDLNDAISIASRIPEARIGCVEVRPINISEYTKA